MEELKTYSDNLVKALNDSVMVSRLAHWNVRGSNFYEAHLLFERIYNSLSEHMDGLIETLRCFDYNPEFEVFSGPDGSFQSYDCHYLGSMVLDYIMSLSSSLKIFFDFCEDFSDNDPRIIGLSNHIQNISDAILSDMYLLQAYLGA